MAKVSRKQRKSTKADAVREGEMAGSADAPSAKMAKAHARASSLIDTRVIYCGDCLDQLRNLPAHSIDLIYMDPPFSSSLSRSAEARDRSLRAEGNSNRNYEAPGGWGETKEKRAFEDRHASTQAYIEYMRLRCVEPPRSRVLKSVISPQTRPLHASATTP